MNEADVPYIIVATKTDKLNKTERKKAVETLISNPILREGTTIILFSSETREGKDDVWNEIIGYAER
jgi:GTP-binding protein